MPVLCGTLFSAFLPARAPDTGVVTPRFPIPVSCLFLTLLLMSTRYAWLPLPLHRVLHPPTGQAAWSRLGVLKWGALTCLPLV